MPYEKLQFTNSDGHKLSAKLDTPDGEINAYAIIAHCFTCSKDFAAASRLAKRLTEHGFGVLRFDFAGLGGSEGDFADTNFTTNVQDLICAVNFLEERGQSASLMVGHSLGGAAVLVAASLLPSIKAVATVGAPSNVQHVSHHFADKLDIIESEGIADVKLAGRKFTIKKQFLDDIKNFNVINRVKELKTPLMIFHSPQDETVSIEHAKNIYVAAKHPKSFISLDGADHLLTKKQDDEFVAACIAAWSKRYVIDLNQSLPAAS